MLKTASLDKIEFFEYALLYASRILIIVSALLSFFLVNGLEHKLIITGIVLWMFIYGIGALVSKFDIKYKIFEYPVLIADFISVFIIYSLTGGLHSPYHFLFLLIIFTATLFYGPKAGMFTSLLSTLGISFTNYLPNVQHNSFESLVGHAAIFLLAGIFFTLFGYLKDHFTLQKYENTKQIEKMQAKQNEIRDRIRTIKQFGQHIIMGADTETINKLFLETLIDLPEVDEIMLRILEEDKLKTKAFIGEIAKSVSDVNLKICDSWTKEIVSLEKSFVIHDVKNEPDFVEKLKSDNPSHFDKLKGIKSVIIVPIGCCKQRQGFLLVWNKNRPHCFTQEHVELIETLASALAVFLEKEKLYETVKNNLVNSVRILSRAVDAKDKYTHNHSINVANFAVAIGKELHLSDDDLEKLYLGGILHDIGKIGIQDSIINKQAKLDDHEWEIMKMHSKIGADMLGDLGSFNEIIDMVAHHHEREDGTGYPNKLHGHQLTLLTKILIVADAFDAMVSDRPYRKALPIKYIKDELKKNAGKQFDVKVVEALLGWIDKQHVVKRVTAIDEIAV